jgi:hypothetical protein
MGIVVGYDATHENIATLPKGQVAGYTTGTPDIVWTPDDWDAHPGALRICQDAGATDVTADYLDVETGAATPADCPGWYKRALAAYTTGVRPGQRHPSIYCAASNVTNVVNALKAGGVDSGPGLIVADWDLTQAQSVADVQAGAGPFPIRGVQFHNEGTYDIDVWDSAWVDTTSAKGGLFRQVVTGTIEEFAEARDANTANLFSRSEKAWTADDKSFICNNSKPMVVYTVNP